MMEIWVSIRPGAFIMARVTLHSFNWINRRIYQPNAHTIRLLDGSAEEIEPRVCSNTHDNDHASSSTDSTASDAVSSSLGKRRWSDGV
ncbi:hypothetical protein BJ138DRAFT_881992 [Hygrophoropsis aurantiaca]|uniref:Uncharacterized protein n=1 Tax=Hygrophoropsis aurantiaca TaxID=72124 RepID=A0ACB8AG82_9AGAM|nr:hypothetical protein BJ138DRAFT_881992 [Hygrophoropsis aurantiaca]